MNREAKQTPGPWVCYADLPSVEPDWHIVTNASRMRILANVHIDPGNATDAANAHLIAAAPDMFEALVAAQERLKTMAGLTEGRSDDEWVWQAQALVDAALSRARGEQS